jgi:Ca2+-binding EF-hand superfamily protein
MKANRRKMTLVMAVAALLGTGYLMAQSAPPAPIPFASYDTSGDSKVSAEEFYAARNARIAERAKEGRMMRNLGNAPSFEQFDSDGDGYLSELELMRGQLTHMQQHRAQGRMGGGPGAAPRGGARAVATFSDFDTNSDGVVTGEEFSQVRAERQASKASQGYPMRNAASSPSFESFDGNGDGQLTPDEFVPGNPSRMR